MTHHNSIISLLDNTLFLTDGGLETTLVFHNNIDLPEFAAFVLLENEQGINQLKNYYEPYLQLALQHEQGFILESPTWRSNPDWAQKLGYDQSALDRINRKAIRLMQEIRDQYPVASTVLVSGCVGPRDDGYSPASIMTAQQAEQYHREQIASFKVASADMITAVTMTNIPESVGICKAAQSEGLPVVISFTVETDGSLPTGVSLSEAIEAVDQETDGGPAYYMVNCAHPSHFEAQFQEAAWMHRIKGIRANASKCSHAELDEAEELDEGNPQELANDYAAILQRFPHIKVVGGCCGTDFRHIQAIHSVMQAA